MQYNPYAITVRSFVTDRLIDYTNDTEINFQIVEGSGTGTGIGTVTRKTADCVLLNLPSIGFNFKGKDFTRAYVRTSIQFYLFLIWEQIL
jgi:hypothetical protein